MLQRLHIQNYAIIDDIEICFSSGLNIITGETGAGKSILAGALSLILGVRADSSILLHKEKKCVVEGFFDNTGKNDIAVFLKLNELENEEELVIRREVSSNGKSRAFINDTPVNLQQLRQLSALLVDLHQQFDTLELGDNDFQREVIDALADNGQLLNEYSVIYSSLVHLKKELDELKHQQQQSNKELDYNQFLFDELEEAGLKENELEDLDSELKLLGNAETVKQQLSTIYAELNETEQPIVQQLKILSNRLNTLSAFHTAIPGLVNRMQSAQVELQDIAGEVEHINNGVNYSPERIQIVNDKIAVGYKLLKKHGVTSTNELLAIKESLQIKLDTIYNVGEIISKKEKESEVLLKQCEKQAAVISVNRRKIIKPFTENTNKLLSQVGMPNAQLKVQLENCSMNRYGTDSIELLFNANLPSGQENKTAPFEPLNKVASGGELSRLMLCIKSLVAKKLQLPTLIFDEIDTGISGEAARQVGIIMKNLSAAHQLISITHQPQIAAKADAHYFVYKAVNKDKIITSIRLLDPGERVTKIAQMLSGEKPTEAALANAREMIETND